MKDGLDLDDCLLIPCRNGGKNSREFKHSVSGHFEVENPPLRINTLLFIGSRRKLENYLKSSEGIDLTKEAEWDESFRGVSGLTFPCTDSDGMGLVVIWLPRFDWSLTDFETLSHECLHAAVMVMRMSGQRPRIFSTKDDGEVDDEGLAYRQSSMLASFLGVLSERQQRSYRRNATKRSAV